MKSIGKPLQLIGQPIQLPDGTKVVTLSAEPEGESYPGPSGQKSKLIWGSITCGKKAEPARYWIAFEISGQWMAGQAGYKQVVWALRRLGQKQSEEGFAE